MCRELRRRRRLAAKRRAAKRRAAAGADAATAGSERDVDNPRQTTPRQTPTRRAASSSRSNLKMRTRDSVLMSLVVVFCTCVAACAAACVAGCDSVCVCMCVYVCARPRIGIACAPSNMHACALLHTRHNAPLSDEAHPAHGTVWCLDSLSGYCAADCLCAPLVCARAVPLCGFQEPGVQP